MNSIISEPKTGTLSEAEIDEALRYLNETRDRVLEVVNPLPDGQWRFKSASDSWSIGENIEHLVMVENSFLENYAPRFREAPAAPRGRDVEQEDKSCRAAGADRSTKYKAPPRGMPTGTWGRQDALDQFAAARSRTIAFLQSRELDHRDHVLSHPAIGPLDAYQWVLLIAAHTERHFNQMLEVKADPNFPAQ